MIIGLVLWAILALLYLMAFDMLVKPSFADRGLLAWGIGSVVVWTVVVLGSGARSKRPAIKGEPVPVG